MEFAEKIKQYRAHNDWTQQEVATKLGVSRKTISSWENGRSYPDILCWSSSVTFTRLV